MDVMTINAKQVISEKIPAEKSLEYFQGVVGGLIQYLPFPVEGVDAFVNDEGKFLGWQNLAGEYVEGLPYNETATVIMSNAGLLFPNDWIAGPMVLSACNDEGETVGLTESQKQAIRELVEGA